MRPRTWEYWEFELADLLGLDATICSGNQFHDIGDAADHTNPRDGDFRLLVDAKYTERDSYTMRRGTLADWQTRAGERGKRAVTAVRMWKPTEPQPCDHVVIGVDDFVELLHLAKTGRDALRQQTNAVPPHKVGVEHGV